jgi:hypothetical protein
MKKNNRPDYFLIRIIEWFYQFPERYL